MWGSTPTRGAKIILGRTAQQGKINPISTFSCPKAKAVNKWMWRCSVIVLSIKGRTADK